jgi:hypothetical protein
MGIPQVPDDVKRAPTLALRAVFAGIGRILLLADRPQGSPDAGSEADDQYPQRSADKRQQGPTNAAPTPVASRWRSLDQTGNVRLLTAADLDDDYAAGRAGEPGTARPTMVGPADLAVPVPGSQSVSSTASADASSANGGPRSLPMANYDALSLASIRARLRGLDASQLRILAEYERKNAERPEVLGMFERRIEKLETAGGSQG